MEVAFCQSLAVSNLDLDLRVVLAFAMWQHCKHRTHPRGFQFAGVFSSLKAHCNLYSSML